jgi:hypothetical protein
MKTSQIFLILVAGGAVSAAPTPLTSSSSLTKRFDSSVPWIWGGRFYQPEAEASGSSSEAPTPSGSLSQLKKRFDSSVPWIWGGRFYQGEIEAAGIKQAETLDTTN